MARRFREIERGWMTGEADAFEISFDLVSNVCTNWSELLASEEFMGENDEPFETESNPDFYIERLVVDYQMLAIPTALNTTNVLQCWAGLVIFNDREVSLKNAVPLILTTDEFWTEQWRGAQPVSRVLAVRRHKVGLYSPPEGSTPTNSTHNPLPAVGECLQFDVQSKLFLRKGESIVFVVSQTNINDGFHAWLEGDQMSCTATFQALVRKKRGR